MAEQVLDSMDLERERGITIKAQTAALEYNSRDGEIYLLNLIDTPGHVDFSYEVSRSLAACEGALLVVDASQGVEAQTVANCYTAIEQGVEVVPVLNKIDLPSADPEKAIQEIEDVIGIPAQDAIRASAKTGEDVEEILEAVIARVPPPKGDPGGSAAGADHRLLVRQLRRRGDAGAGGATGTLRPKDKILLMSTGAAYLCEQVGVFTPKAKPKETLVAGEVGFVIAGIKELRAAQGRRHRSRSPTSPAASAAARLQGDQAAGVRRPVPGRGERVRGAARGAGEAAPQRRVASTTSRRPRRRWASASAAASSACCTWTSCRSGSSASTTWT